MPTIRAASTIIASVSPGSNIFDSVRSLINEAVYPTLSLARRREACALFACHALILLLSVSGIGWRYWKGSGWLFTSEGGVVRPNMAIVTQGLIAIFSAASMVVIPTYTLNDHPSNAAFVLLVVSYVPVGLAFHAVTWATYFAARASACVPSTTKTTPLRPLASHFAITTALLFVAGLIPPIYLLAIEHDQLLDVEERMLGIVDGAEAGVGLLGLGELQGPSTELVQRGNDIVRLYKVIVGVYLAWIVVWSIVYVPSAIRLLLSLRFRRQRFMRSLHSLRTLADLVAYPVPPPSPTRASPVSRPPPTHIKGFNVDPERKAGVRCPRKLSKAQQGSLGRKFVARTPVAAPASTPSLSTSLSATSDPRPPTPPTTTTPFDYIESPMIRPVNFNDSRPASSLPSLPSLSSLPSLPSTIGSVLLFPLPPSRSFDATTESKTLPSLGPLPSNTLRRGSGGSVFIECMTIEDEWATVSARLTAERIMCEVGLEMIGDGDSESTKRHSMIQVTDDIGEQRSRKRVVELEAILGRTAKLVWSVGVQLGVTMSMALSYATFCLFVLSGRMGGQALKSEFQRWTGWTFVGAALVGSIIFATLSFRGPKDATPWTTSPSPSHQRLSISTLDITLSKENGRQSLEEISIRSLATPSTNPPRSSSQSCFYPAYLQAVFQRRCSGVPSDIAPSTSCSSDGLESGREKAVRRSGRFSGTQVDIEKGELMNGESKRWIPSVWAKERQEEMRAREEELCGDGRGIAVAL